MSRRYINQLGHQEAVHETFLASNKQLRSNRNGNLFLQVDLSDRTGAISTRMWNASEEMFRSFENGDFVRVEGTTQLYQGALQMIATQVTPVPRNEVDLKDFLTLSPEQIETLAASLARLLRSIQDPHLRNLADCFLVDEEFLARFSQAPAAIKHHHAYTGGLLEHVVNIMEVIDRIADRFPQVDRDLLIMGAFLHDVGKIDELGWTRGLEYTDEGQLLGHLVLAVSLLDAKVAEAVKLSGEPIPDEKVLRLKHMIISHHGHYEYGSPKLPMTLEAIALHHLDNLDAKIKAFEQQMRDDAGADSPWTLFIPAIGRKLYKGRPPRDGSANSAGT